MKLLLTCLALLLIVTACSDNMQGDASWWGRHRVSAQKACTDGIINRAETDVDCGGDTCAKCTVGKMCERDRDCITRECSRSGICVNSSVPANTTTSPPSLNTTNATNTTKPPVVNTTNSTNTTKPPVVNSTNSTNATKPPIVNTTNTSGIYKPALVTSWQWQLTTPVDTSVDVQMFDIDLFENDASVVTALKGKGKKVICYMSAGSYEDWRPDAGQFPASVLGKSNGWAGEKWLDIRNIAVLGPIMEKRLDLCKQKGFDGVEFDNVDGYTNPTGFTLTAADQIAYNKFLADAAHKRGLSAGLKNDIDQIPQLVDSFDWALNEQCFQYNECDGYKVFVDKGKAVFNVEYELATSQFCSKANAMNINSLKKNLDLDPSRTACR
jgi:hypothetical protein